MIFRKEKKNINSLTWRYTEKFGIYWKKSIVELNVLFSRLYQKQTPKQWSFSGSLRKFSAKLFLKIHCAKSVQRRSFFWSVFSRIRTECGGDTLYLSVFGPDAGINGPEKNPYLDTFHAVIPTPFSGPKIHFKKLKIT